ncbi:amino acid ABC transporter permease [Streptomyces sp. NPDC058469]|uniref:amino acid ABC transporter permease n=1 Tax=Streptomyces sp. NPDC058469 TaxID=3346514 RepID=UPI0036648BD5
MARVAAVATGHPDRAGHEEETVVPLRHPQRWAAAAAVLVLVAMLLHTLVTNEGYQWGVVADYLTSGSVLAGLGRTVEITAIAMTLGTVLGALLALMRISTNPVLRASSSGYVWFFRGTPLLAQLVFFYNIAALYPRLSLGIPFGPEFVSGNVNGVLTPFVVAVVTFALNEAAYMCEIIRAGILSVDKGQTEAALALGMRPSRVARRVVLPQAMRVILPPTANQLTSMLKATSLVSVISFPDLLYSVQVIYTRNFQTIPLLIVACAWYLTVTTFLTAGQYFVERHFSQGFTGGGKP